MEVAAASFEYNRDNFMEDREMRMKKEFMERKMRCVQGGLWREDVRDFVDLTERKMKYYLLVNVLLLGFNVNLWCEGRLPENTPHWLVLGNQVSIGGSFVFLLMTVWLANHAAVAAQSYGTRLLTQLVRLPLPTWDELEACRTAGSEFEKLEATQMLRIPFLMGPQERLGCPVPCEVDESNDRPLSSGGRPRARTVASSADSLEEAGIEEGGAPDSAVPVDPWGLERPADDLCELGCRYSAEVAGLRHVKLMRQAAVYWQTYDAFARVSMSIGTNQLLLAMSYFIIGYVRVQVNAPVVAFAAMATLVCMSEVIAHIDLTLRVKEQRVIQVLLILGPAVSCAAAFDWEEEQDGLANNFDEGLACIAFFSHGLVLALMTLFLRVVEQENGAMLPLAFQGVLYLDPFGWIRQSDELPPRSAKGTILDADQDLDPIEEEELGPTEEELEAQRAKVHDHAIQWHREELKRNKSKGVEDTLSFYAMDYVGPCAREKDRAEEQELEASHIGEHMDKRRVSKPSAAAVRYDDGGIGVPMRPDDMLPPGAGVDLRLHPGAPRAWENVSAVTPPGKEFFEPITFMPAEGRRRHKVDEFLEDEDAATQNNMKQMASHTDEGLYPIETGHDHESPGLAPWKIFRTAAIMLCLVWLFAGVYSLLDTVDAWTPPADLEGWEPGSKSPNHRKGVVAEAYTPRILNLLVQRLTTGARRAPRTPERIAVSWPRSGLTPNSLSCDASGSVFIATDGLSAFQGAIFGGRDALLDLGDGGRPHPHNAARLRRLETEVIPVMEAGFRDAPSCGVLQGESMQDSAIVCNEQNHTVASQCEALVLNRHGRRIAACPLSNIAAIGNVSNAPLSLASSQISAKWLRAADLSEEAGKRHAEKGSWILIDPECRGSGSQALLQGCLSLGTSLGRVAQMQLQHSGSGKELAPAELLTGEKESQRPGVVRSLGSRYLGVLHPHGRSIAILDATNKGLHSGRLLLPRRLVVSSFCAGGGYVYLLGKGKEPDIWRIPLPDSLQSSTDAFQAPVTKTMI